MKNLNILLLFFLPFFSLSQVPEKNYAKFDFVPGENLIFEDDFSEESTDEIPSHWVISKGKVEMLTIDNELVMGFLDESPSAFPRRKESKIYSERYTVEFDYLWRNNSKTWIKAVGDGNAGKDRIQIQFATDKEWESLSEKLGDFQNNLVISSLGEVEFKTFKGNYKSGEKMNENEELYQDLCDKWVHVSIAITEKSLKVYLNSERVLNAQIESGFAPSIQILADGSTYEYDSQLFLKNFRIAEGGADPYKTLMTDGKIIARGINFDKNKASIKPESLGTINTIVKILTTYPELKFEIGGHTDSDGDDASNLELSQKRAEKVMEKLIELGVDKTRLSAIGYGEGKPISDNKTFEGKATNRRVEFVKI